MTAWGGFGGFDDFGDWDDAAWANPEWGSIYGAGGTEGTEGTEDSVGSVGLPGMESLMPTATGGGTDRLTVDLDGTSYELPASTTVPGHEIVEESVTLTDETGMTILSDTDGDGHVDYMSVVTFDGGWSAWRREAVMTDMPTDDMPGVSSVTIYSSQGEPDCPARTVNPQGKGVPGNGESSETPPGTPENGTANWDVVGWECVERGQWG